MSEPIMQCPLHSLVIPATCLTQEGVNPILAARGYWLCTLTGRLVRPVILTSAQYAEYVADSNMALAA